MLNGNASCWEIQNCLLCVITRPDPASSTRSHQRPDHHHQFPKPFKQLHYALPANHFQQQQQ